MKFIIILFFLSSIFSQISGQSRPERLGMREFDLLNYEGAINYFERIDNKSVDVKRKLAQSHFFLNNINEALTYFAEVASSDQTTPEDFWNYAQALMSQERYQDAKQQLERFYQTAPSDSRAFMYQRAGDFVAEIRSKASNIDIKHLRINQDSQDFGPVYYRNQVVYASTRITDLPDRGIWSGNKLPYLSPYIADKASDGELLNPRPFLADLLLRDFHVGPIAIDHSEEIMAVTVNYGADNKAGKTINLQLLVSYFIDGKWTDLKPVPFNNPEYSVGHATFTPDGKTMYFASDMPGGKGGIDIYKVDLLDNKQWSTPVNVSEINTEGNEMFPFYHKDDILFFSSDGHVGLGGLDIFYSQITDGKFSDIINIGYPVNSSRDDFSIVIDNEYKTGYFASRREGSLGNDDLYHITFREPFIDKPVAMPPVTEIIVAPPPTPEPEKDYKPGDLIEINPIYFDFDKSDIRPDAARELDKIIAVMNVNPTMVLELGAHTDCRGTDAYNVLLSKARMHASLQYIKDRINNPERITGFFYGKTRLINRCDCSEEPPCTETEHQLNRRTEFIIISM
jgi:outer membrane protein OmpA-like peptidoglycan-associated protein